jgi:hypothetical protein
MSVAREASDKPVNPPGRPLVSAGNSDRCPVCGAHLAVDQRYCVECGTRRGAARFSLVGASATSAAVAPSAPSGGAFQRAMRSSSNVALLLGLLILLVALGIGVLIGHNGNAKSPGQPKVNVTLNSAGSAGSSAATTPAASASATKATHSTAKSAAKKTVTKKAAAAASATNPNAAAKGKAGTAAAAKSFGSSAAKKSTVGGSCTAGTPGCSNGKQTGNLF